MPPIFKSIDLIGDFSPDNLYPKQVTSMLLTKRCQQMCPHYYRPLGNNRCPASLQAVKAAAASFKPRIYSSKDLNGKADPWFIFKYVSYILI